MQSQVAMMSRVEMVKKKGGERKRRSHDLNLSRMTSAEIVQLEQSVDSSTWQDDLRPLLPLLAWAAWIMIGALFYGFVDELTWYEALYMSVNVGWSMGWTMDWEYERTVANSLFSTLHTSIGVVFIGVAVIYIAKEVGKNKDTWIIQMMKKKELDAAAETEGYKDDILAFFSFHLPKLKMLFAFLVWYLAGIIWFALTLPDSTNVWELLDFVLSTLSGGGYLAIDTDSSQAQYVITSLYTTIGVPLMSIALGLLLSLMMEAPEDKSIFEKIVASVTEEEIEFMKIFEIDDGDGTIDSKEFIILTVVRIGAAPPQLINQIHSRFNMLDRKHEGKIEYDSIVFGRKKKVKKQNSFNSNLLLPVETDADEGGSEKKSPALPRSSSSTKMEQLNSRLKRVNSFKVANSNYGTRTKSLITQISTNASERQEESQLSPKHDIERGISEKSFTETEDFEVLPEQKTVASEGLEEYDKTNKLLEKKDKNSSTAVENSSQVVCLSSIDDGSFRSIRSFDEVSDEGKRFGDNGNNGQSEESSEESNTKKSTWSRFKQLNGVLGSFSDRIRIANKTAPPLGKANSMSNVSTSTALPAGRRAFRTAHTFDEIAKSIKNESVQEKMKKAKEKVESRLKIKEDANIKASLLLANKMKSLMKNVYFFCLAAWFIWLLTGTIFYYYHENVSLSKGLYMSVSVGYGIFWIPQKGDNLSRVFTTFHFTIGIFAIALAMAVFARSLISAEKNWYIEAMNKKKFEEAKKTEGYKDDVIAAIAYYWPKLKVHFVFLFWMWVGIAFGLGTGKWSFVDSLFFALSAMATGGFVSLDEDSPTWEFFFVALYVIIGVPFMTISCGLLAHNMANYGASDKLEEKIHAQVTEDELEMMKLLKIEDGDGCIDGTEFTILILVRIGALNPDLIGVLYERFHDLDVKQEGKISYDDLKMSHEVGSSKTMKGKVHTGKIHTRLGYGQ